MKIKGISSLVRDTTAYHVEKMNKVGAHMGYNDKLLEVQKKTDKNIKLELINGRKKVRKTWTEILENDDDISLPEIEV